MNLDRDTTILWHKLVCRVLSVIARGALAIGKRIHLPFLRLGEIAVEIHTRHSDVVCAALTEQIAELNRAVAVEETRKAWEQRHQP